jgi:hypothetical protein
VFLRVIIYIFIYLSLQSSSNSSRELLTELLESNEDSPATLKLSLNSKQTTLVTKPATQQTLTTAKIVAVTNKVPVQAKLKI